MIVIGGGETAGWVQLLRASGLAVRPGTVTELPGRTAAVVAGDAGLAPDQVEAVRRWVLSGGSLVASDPQLLERLGWRRGGSRAVSAVRVTGASAIATWRPSIPVRPLTRMPASSYLVLARAVSPASAPSSASPPTSPVPTAPPRTAPIGPVLTPTTAPMTAAPGNGGALLVQAGEGRGHVLAAAVDPLADGRVGYELFPQLGRLVGAAVGAPPGPTRTGAEVYLDPGTLHGALKGDPERLADYLQDAAVVQVAGWNFSGGSATYNYDYAALIAALHRRGVLVYAWLEPPLVNQGFWEFHPECREKTATGVDAFVDWRHLSALEDPRCMEMAWGEWQDLLTRYDWDGVNVAELYFEPLDTPATATPYHPSALQQFGRDPKADPSGFLQFRKDLVVHLNDQMLRQLNGLPRAANLQFELTVIDDHLDPALGTGVGSDVGRLADVARRNGATLQVEDPYTVWGQGPLRYDRLNADLASLRTGGPVFVDVNVVDRARGLPTPAMTGAEQDLAIMSAGRTDGRVAAYSAGTIGPTDMGALAGALAGAAATVDAGVRAPWAVTVHSPGGPGDVRLLVDGVQWPAGPGFALVPAGEHRLDWSAGAAAGPGLLRLTGELATARVDAHEVDFSYDSRPVTYATVTQRPRAVRLDGADAPVDAVASGPQGTVLRLPPGTHRVVLLFD